MLRAMTLVGAGWAALLSGADWPQFRGPNASGVSDTVGLPSEFGPSKNVVWKTALPAGHSSPVGAFRQRGNPHLATLSLVFPGQAAENLTGTDLGEETLPRAVFRGVSPVTKPKRFNRLDLRVPPSCSI